MSFYTKIGKKAGGFLLGVGSSNFSRKAVKKVGGKTSTIKLSGNLLKSMPKKVGGGRAWNTKIVKAVAKGSNKASKNIQGVSKTFTKSKPRSSIFSPKVAKATRNTLLAGTGVGLLGLGGTELYDHAMNVFSTTKGQRQAEKDTEIMQDRKDLFDNILGSGQDYGNVGDSMGLGGLPSVGSSGNSEVSEGSSLMNVGLIAGAVGGSYLIYKKMKKSKKSKK